jgi:hypothetical protein
MGFSGFFQDFYRFYNAFLEMKQHFLHGFAKIFYKNIM